jgi:hypothetical protein
MTQDRIVFQPCGEYRLCVLDLSNIQSSDAGLELIAEAQRLIAEHPPKSLRVLTDVSGSHMSLPVIAALQELARENAPYVTRSAIYGLSLPHRVALRQIRRLTGRDIREFTNRDEALTYLRS